MPVEESNPFLITPPPGVPVPLPSAPEPVEVEPEAEEFIALPPGIADSATLRLAERARPAPKPAAANDYIVFFPVVPGVPVAPAAPQADTGAEPEADSEATRLSTARHAAPVWRLVLPDGQAVPVAGSVFVGRNPARTPERPDAALLPVADPSKSLSKTHALLEVDDGLLWVHDLDSTNGVVVAMPGDEIVEVDPGTRVLVPAGADLELGDYVIQVEHG